MHIASIYIRNFRGISELTWTPQPGVNCLIGPGDSGKTTILDAIELLFTERHNVVFDDLDFFEASPTNHIRLAAVVVNLPDELLRDNKYGLMLSGWKAETNEWRSEPSEGDGFRPALTLQLDVDETLEPVWFIPNEHDLDDKTRRVRFGDRKLMAPARLGVYADRHLSWGRGSALARVGEHPERLPADLNELLRAARDTFAERSSKTFEDLIDTVAPDIQQLGVEVKTGLAANLDHTSFSTNASGVALHDGNVPLRCLGTGSSRLAVAALQSAKSAGRHLFLVDELEFGLEPHRISLLVSHLRRRVEASGQLFVTTHSITTLRDVRFNEVFLCRRDARNGKVTVAAVSSSDTPVLSAKKYVRDKGEALLARSVLVCEGQTEIALLKGYAEGAELPFHSNNVVLVDGGGGEAPDVAVHFDSLGYRTALFTDSDTEPKPAQKDAVLNALLHHFQWGDDRCTEQELFMGTSLDTRKSLWQLMIRERDERRIIGEVSTAANRRFQNLEEIEALLENEEGCRTIGLAAHKNKWIKRDFDMCFEIGKTVLAPQALIGEGSIDGHLDRIFKWLNGNA
ncbi:MULTISPECIES: AAA family ATPase [unclassified Caballeronia]|uniref:ATP-dependent nuclease n=1 Tax=unclassified Caballeronia TaxID=2646786 RepID=UPI0028636E8E|nr:MULTISPECIES: AAA family ATPase [unclassified Caballeronia]MDR5776851.1 AAA family ATPase [Caballeronia sp. LZ002]MDR5798843.1 AAA family ATPase [Caballeronia sp. LZ001]MDR5852364.1 AAA family ATPase [Caballeronia sp. LZ003]